MTAVLLPVTESTTTHTEPGVTAVVDRVMA